MEGMIDNGAEGSPCGERQSMFRPLHRLLGGLLIVLIALLPVLGLHAAQIDGRTYESPQFGYLVEWDERWAALDRHVISDDGVMDRMMLSNNDGRVWVTGYPASVDAADAVQEAFSQNTSRASEIEINQMLTDGDLSLAEFRADHDRFRIEAWPHGDATVVVMLMARVERFETALSAAREGLAIDEAAVLTGQPPFAETGRPDDPAPADEGAGDESPFDRLQATATPDEGDEADETPAPAEEDEAPAEDAGAPSPDTDSYLSPGFGYTVGIPAGWQIVNNQGNGTSTETLVLDNGVSTVTLLATSEYAGELPGCVIFARNMLEEDPIYENLRLQSTAGGEPFQGADDFSAYALFWYTGTDGERQALYVRCQHIVEGESVLILIHDVPQAEYVSQRSARAAIVNAIDVP